MPNLDGPITTSLKREDQGHGERIPTTGIRLWDKTKTCEIKRQRLKNNGKRKSTQFLAGACLPNVLESHSIAVLVLSRATSPSFSNLLVHCSDSDIGPLSKKGWPNHPQRQDVLCVFCGYPHQLDRKTPKNIKKPLNNTTFNEHQYPSIPSGNWT